MSSLDPRRKRILTEAEAWLGTPFHHGQLLKGAGCDCLTFLVGVFEAAEVVSRPELPFYRPDFMQHQTEETYLNGLLAYGREVKVPLPGDVAIFRWGRIYAHAGIVVEWPEMIHAHPNYGVMRMRGDVGRLLNRGVRFISAFGDAS